MSVISLTSVSPFISFYAIGNIYIYMKPREHGDCMFRNEWLHRFNFKPWPGPGLGRLGTGTFALG